MLCAAHVDSFTAALCRCRAQVLGGVFSIDDLTGFEITKVGGRLPAAAAPMPHNASRARLPMPAPCPQPCCPPARS